MESPLDFSKVNFIVDNEGHKTAAILPYELYQQLMALKSLIAAPEEAVETQAEFEFAVKQAVAFGYPVGAKHKPNFVVTKGSTANISDADSLRPAVQALRDQLIQEHVLCHEGDVLQFMRDYQFSSPSAAACMIAGNARSGLDAWVDRWGKSLKVRGYGKKR